MKPERRFYKSTITHFASHHCYFQLDHTYFQSSEMKDTRYHLIREEKYFDNANAENTKEAMHALKIPYTNSDPTMIFPICSIAALNAMTKRLSYETISPYS